jgi:hypothetical protein
VGGLILLDEGGGLPVRMWMGFRCRVSDAILTARERSCAPWQESGRSLLRVSGIEVAMSTLYRFESPSPGNGPNSCLHPTCDSESVRYYISGKMAKIKGEK